MFRFPRTRSCGGWFRRSRRWPSLDAPISIDTSKAAVAREAARLGACVINDVWGMQRDPGMADAVAETGSAVVIMHNRDADGPGDRHSRRRRSFLRALAQPRGRRRRALRPHPARSGNRLRQDAAAEPCLHLEPRPLPPRLGAPILVGLSRKSFIGGIIDAEVDRRLPGTLAADTIALMRGASVLRVHDVAENRAALAVFMALQARRRAVRSRRSPRTTAGRASSSRLAAMSATRRRACAGRSRALAGEREIELAAVSRFYRTPPGARPTRTGSSTPARSAARASSRRRCSNASRRSRSSSAASLRSDGGRASSTSTSSPTAT